jgi:Xaa-Pro aminopeptidase
MDIGAEYDHYAADVSRTIPVSGKFSPEQKKIYEIVLKAQKAAMAKIKPGAYVREDVHAEARRVIEAAGYGEYFIHGTSHFIGLDVHDVGDYGQPLRPGMVISVEPGIYIPDKGIGVRIEDDVLITKDGYKLLTAGIPREIDEIEKLLSKK